MYMYMISARGSQTVFDFFVCYATFAMQSLQCNLCTAIFALQFLLWALKKELLGKQKVANDDYVKHI